MTLEWLPMEFSVCQLDGMEAADMSRPFTFIARTDEEISLVCPMDAVVDHPLKREDGWRCLRVKGPLDFALIGVLARITACLADAGIPVFAISTYNTDYLLIRTETFSSALHALEAAGYEMMIP